jgi:cell wall-associated NlpC family hydrolase
MNRNSIKSTDKLLNAKVAARMTMAGLAGAMLVGGSSVTALAAEPVVDNTGASSTTVQAQAQEAAPAAAEAAVAEAAPAATEAPAEAPQSEFANIGVSNVADYVNIRSAASTDSEVLGKLYASSAATVLESVQDAEGTTWFHVQSGSVDGYVRGDYLTTGNEELAKSIATRTATVKADVLNVRTDPSTDAGIYTQLANGAQVSVLDESQAGWLKVAVDGREAYISADYADLSTSYKVAESKAEEQARLEAEAAARRAAEEAAAREAAARKAEEEADAQKAEVKAREAAEKAEAKAEKAAEAKEKAEAEADAEAEEAAKEAEAKARAEAEAARKAAEEAERKAQEEADKAAQDEAEESKPEVSAPEQSGNGSAVVSFASQFVGNPYVWGGTSLTNGADCSGFVMSVYANFGVSLPHSSAAMRSVGVGVSASNMQPGDIVCYDGHVGIYAGNGQIVNALNAKKGITYTNVNYSPIVAVRRVL